MNHWKETSEIVARIAELRAAGRHAGLATVVGIVGSAYRRPGARFLIEDSGATLGSVSGGCLEVDVREVARAVLATGTPRLRHYSTSADEDVVWGLGLGCNGSVDVFVQPGTAGPFAEIADHLRGQLAGDAPLALFTQVEGDGLGSCLLVDSSLRTLGTLGRSGADTAAAALASSLITTGRSGLVNIAGQRTFLEVLFPPPNLLVCGAGDDAGPLVTFAAEAGFRVSVLDHREALLQAHWFPRALALRLVRAEDSLVVLPPAQHTLAVVKTHSLAQDREWVRRLLQAGLPYVGVLGPRERTQGILRDIGASSDSDRVYGPVGLDLGADGPQQVAISIVAELLAFQGRRQPRHLRQRQEAIHDR
jgi:xanthine dehydrogenase accessory factor